MLSSKRRVLSEVLGRSSICINPVFLSCFRCIGLNVVMLDQKGKKKDSMNFKRNTSLHTVNNNVAQNNKTITVVDSNKILKKSDIQTVLVKFFTAEKVRKLAKENGLDLQLLRQGFNDFRSYCMITETLPKDLHIIISNIVKGKPVTDLFPHFILHAKKIFPHLDFMEELKRISDLRTPAKWYEQARSMKRKIIFHAGPTNSGKTYHALERFRTAKSGLYCGPLKLLATEVYRKANNSKTPCDLVTGEERLYAKNPDDPADHVACTVEMARVDVPCEVAVIDEIQLLKDYGRGWAWTRALLGIPAQEIHLCGEPGAIDLVRAICATAGEELEVRNYERLTKLEIENKAICSMKNIQPGDCIVCFNKQDIYKVSRELESMGIEVAVIYGSLPPNTKLSQAEKFNNPNNSCKVLVATDAIGMGLNLHIRRIIFYSMSKSGRNSRGEMIFDRISTSAAKQIAGRAGRFGTQWENGFVTTLKPHDLPLLNKILDESFEPLKQAGLHPTSDQIELCSFYLPDATLSNVIDIFISLCTVDDSLYFMCNIDDFKYLADEIEHVRLPLRQRYVYSCAPIDRKNKFLCQMFLSFARRHSKNEMITFNWLCEKIGWPIVSPKTMEHLVRLESIFDVLDLYLWLSYRFVKYYPDAIVVKDIQKELDEIIRNGIIQLTKLSKNENNTESINDYDNNSHVDVKKQYYGEGELSDKLLSTGVLTPAMLRRLQREWSNPEQKKNNCNYGRTKKEK